jgi:hypothetical protein
MGTVGGGQSEMAYRGYGPDNPAGGRLVVVEIGGEVTGPLPHHIKHSPSGYSWGYLGSGPADLSESQPRYSETMGCQYCERGCAVQPRLYQRFKRFPTVAGG